MNSPDAMTRRRWFQRGAMAGVPLLLPARVWAQSPAARIQVGFIGLGKRGRSHLGAFLAMPDVRVTAVADVHAARRQAAVDLVHAGYAAERTAGTYKGCAAHNDFRELLARKDVDAVVIATPDHWHAIQCIQAANAKKDIYCETPLTSGIAEGRVIVRAVRRNFVVFQTGCQERTEYDGRFRRAVEYVRSGRVGRLKRIVAGAGEPPRECDLPSQPTPAEIDWNLWLGPAAQRSYHTKLCPLPLEGRKAQWQDFRDFGGGRLAARGAHSFDVVQWALGVDSGGPSQIIPPADEVSEIGLRLVYPSGVEVVHEDQKGVRFEGTRGTLYVDRDVLRASHASIIEQPLGKNEFHLPISSAGHRRDWLRCIRTRQRPSADVEVGVRTATVCHLANIGYQLRRKLRWEPLKEDFTGDAKASELLHREYRRPWVLG